MYLIKKYRNRKLYLSTLTINDKKVSGRYITSYQLLELDKEKGVQVINDQTKADITDEAILSAIFELAKEDLEIRTLLLKAFHEGEKALVKPSFLFDPIDAIKKDKVTPALNVKERTINETVTIPENTPIAKTSEDFSGF